MVNVASFDLSRDCVLVLERVRLFGVRGRQGVGVWRCEREMRGSVHV